MANISKIKIGTSTYNIKDAQLRSNIIWQQPKKLWQYSSNDSWAVGASKTLPTAGYLFLGCISNTVGATCMMIGTWHHPLTRETETQRFAMAMGYDNGTSYIGKAYFQVTSGKSWTLLGGSRHNLATSGNPGAAITTINSFWGIL